MESNMYRLWINNALKQNLLYMNFTFDFSLVIVHCVSGGYVFLLFKIVSTDTWLEPRLDIESKL